MIKEVIVVEGKNDTKRLKEFFDVDTIETNGLALNDETINFIIEINKKRGVILFLDPDNPGEKIRQRLNSKIKGLKNAFIIKEDARTNKKVGIEHASKKALEEALNNLITYSDSKNSINFNDLYSLGLCGNNNSSYKREIVSKYFHIGSCNNKSLLKRLNMLGVTYEKVKEALSE